MALRKRTSGLKRATKQTAPQPRKKTTMVWIMAGVSLLVSAVAVYLALKIFSVPGPGEVSLPPLPPGSAPIIAAAKILPDKPQANTDLTAEYQAQAPEGAAVQYTFRWFVNGSIIQEGPGATLPAGSVKKGESVSVEIVPSAATGQGSAYKTGTVQIANLPPSITAIAITPPQPVPGTVLTADVAGEDPDRDQVTFRYQWTVNGQPSGATQQASKTFNTAGLRKKDGIAVTVTPFDGEEAGKPVISEIIALMNSAPQITSTPPTAVENGVYSYQVTASDPDGDRLVYSLDKAPQGMTIDAGSGLIRWEPQAQGAGRQEIPVKIKVDDNDGGTVFQEYSLFLEPQ